MLWFAYDERPSPYAFTSIKIGPGDSARSHTADEYIRLTEIAQGIEIYYSLLDNLTI